MKYLSARGVGRKTWFVFLFACLGTACWLVQSRFGSTPNISKNVLLLPAEGVWNPVEPIEVRFEQAVASEDIVGLANQSAPIVSKPQMPGTFVWLSQRHGVFHPTAAPSRGTRIRLTLASSIIASAPEGDRPLLDRTLMVAPFAAEALASGYLDAHNVPVRPFCSVTFNEQVNPAEAVQFLSFRQAGSKNPSIPAKLSVSEFWCFAPVLPATNVAQTVQVMPERALAPGDGWELVIRVGLPSADHAFAIGQPQRTKLGTVRPFHLAALNIHNTVNNGRRVALTFNQEFAPGVTSSNLDRWIQISQRPDNAFFELWKNRIVAHGDFALSNNYRIKVAQNLSSSEGLMLTSSFTTNVHFEPMSPRIYFPTFTGDQLTLRDRGFPIRVVNLSGVQVRAKQLDATSLIHALRGYRSYVRDRYDDLEPNAGLDYNVVPGRTVFENRFYLDSKIDAAGQVDLNWDTVLGHGQPGAVFLSANAGSVRDSRQARGPGCQAVVQLTDLGLVWKQADGQMLVSVFSYQTGSPVTNARIRLFTDESESLTEAVTDASGLARMTVPTNAPAGLWLMADHGRDLHAVPLSDYGGILSMDHFSIPTAPSPPAEHKLFILSDRSVYRPGDVLHLKAIGRKQTSDGFASLASGPAQIKVTDPRGQVFFQTNIPWSALGSVATTLLLPERTRGNYEVQLISGTFSANHFFSVRDIKPNAFKIQLKAPVRVSVNQRCRIPIHATHLNGSPVRKARVTWALQLSASEFMSERFKSFHFGIIHLPGINESDTPPATAHGQVTLDNEGAAVIDLDVGELIAGELPQMRQAVFQVEVTDLSQQTLSASAEFAVDTSAFYLGLHAEDLFVPESKPIHLHSLAVAPDGVSVSSPFGAALKVKRINWRTQALRTAGRVLTYRNQADLEPVLEQAIQFQPGTNSIALAPLPAGNYLVELSAQDLAGNAIKTTCQLVVEGRESVAWPRSDQVRMQIAPEQESYQPGDTAAILIKAPFTGTALVTVERENIRRSFVTNLTSQAQVIRLPVVLADVPNVFVSVFLWRGTGESGRKSPQPEFRVGYCQLIVDPLPYQLKAVITLSQDAIRPGQSTEVVVQVADWQGRPAANTEVTLYAVDEGLLLLKDDGLPDLMDFFYSPRPLAVTTHHSFGSLLPGESGEMLFNNKGFIIGGGGFNNTRTRRNFIPCPLWEPGLITDARGQARVRFTAPDSLSRYRVIAVVQDGGSRFGAVETALTVHQPVMLEPGLPSFARVGDQITARALVHNETTQAATMEIRLSLDAVATSTAAASLSGSAASSNLVQTIDVSAKGSAFVDFPVSLVSTGMSVWTWSAAPQGNGADGFKDVVQSRLKVIAALPSVRVTHSVELPASGKTRLSTNLLAGLRRQLEPGEGTLQVQVAGSEIIALTEMGAQLLEYPYGCVEQTSSSLLPWITLRSLPGHRLVHGAEESEAAIAHGIERLFSMQTYAGGLSYWPGQREPMFWGSAYAAFALALARQNEVAVPEGEFAKLLDYLQSVLHEGGLSPEQGLSGQCLAVCALAAAGRNSEADLEKLYTWRAALNFEDRALLALTFASSGKGSSPMVNQLLFQKEGKQAAKLPGVFASELRAQALRLFGLARALPEHPSLHEAAYRLFHEQQLSGYHSTQENAWCLLALTEYVRVSKNLSTPVRGELTLGDTQNPFELDAKKPLANQTFTYSPQTSSQELILHANTARTLFAQVTAEYVPATPPKQSVSQGFQLVRRYLRVNDDSTTTPAERFTVGERVMVELIFGAKTNQTYVALNDPLPASLEVIHSDLKSHAAIGHNLATESWPSSFRENRSDRVLHFFDHLPAGEHTVRYLARVRSAGTVLAPPARVEAMYQPARYGATTAQTLNTTAQ
ncbi:MAG: hypothetical protein EXS31_14225 [Pedosphaera sp.]|nr:hypothetical protein [Pedosphaera sp.]